MSDSTNREMALSGRELTRYRDSSSFHPTVAAVAEAFVKIDKLNARLAEVERERDDAAADLNELGHRGIVIDQLRLALASEQARTKALREALRCGRNVELMRQGATSDAQCDECNAMMSTPDGLEPTPECNTCAQAILRYARELIASPSPQDALDAYVAQQTERLTRERNEANGLHEGACQQIAAMRPVVEAACAFVDVDGKYDEGSATQREWEDGAAGVIEAVDAYRASQPQGGSDA